MVTVGVSIVYPKFILWSAVFIGGDLALGHPETPLSSITGSGQNEGTVSFISIMLPDPSRLKGVVVD